MHACFPVNANLSVITVVYIRFMIDDRYKPQHHCDEAFLLKNFSKKSMSKLFYKYFVRLTSHTFNLNFLALQ